MKFYGKPQGYDAVDYMTRDELTDALRKYGIEATIFNPTEQLAGALKFNILEAHKAKGE